VAQVRAVALAAVESARAREDDWLLRQARLAVRKWRYSAECIDRSANGCWPDLRPALRQVQDVLGAIQVRATLIDAVERFARKRARPGLQPLIQELKAEKLAAFRRFQALAGTLAFPSSAQAAAARVIDRRVERATSNAAPVSTDERWERMAQWLLGATPER
jgi:CHAD domain-containing protein